MKRKQLKIKNNISGNKNFLTHQVKQAFFPEMFSLSATYS